METPRGPWRADGDNTCENAVTFHQQNGIISLCSVLLEYIIADAAWSPGSTLLRFAPCFGLGVGYEVADSLCLVHPWTASTPSPIFSHSFQSCYRLHKPYHAFRNRATILPKLNVPGDGMECGEVKDGRHAAYCCAAPLAPRRTAPASRQRRRAMQPTANACARSVDHGARNGLAIQRCSRYVPVYLDG